MRDYFNCDRTTENFYRYVSETADRNGMVDVIYLPRELNNGAVNPPGRLPLIVHKMRPNSLDGNPAGNPVRTYPIPKAKCCHRDNDGDGNCHIHSSPGVLRETALPPGTYEATIQGVRKIGEKTIAIDLETKGLDPIYRGRVIHTEAEQLAGQSHGDWRYHMRDLEEKMSSKVDIGFFNWKMDAINSRLKALEDSAQVLFKAVYWILRKFRVVK